MASAVHVATADAIFDFGPSLWGQRSNLDRFNRMLTGFFNLERVAAV